MTPYELNLLSKAYDNYLKSSEIHFCYTPINGEDMFLSTESISGLLELGYINNVPESVFSDSIDPDTSLSFDLTTSGINYMRSYRKL